MRHLTTVVSAALTLICIQGWATSSQVAGQNELDPALLGAGYQVAYVYLVEDASGEYYALGEVRQANPNAEPGTMYGFNLRFLDQDNDVVSGDYAFFWRESPDRNGMIPFIMDVNLPTGFNADDVPTAEAQSCGIGFAGSFAVYSDDVVFDSEDLTLTEQTGYYAYNLSGKVRNTGSQTNPYDFAVADFHRGDGLLLGMAQVDVGPGLEPDQAGYIDSDFNFYGRRGEQYQIDTPVDDISVHMTGSDGITIACGEGGKWSEVLLIDPDDPFDLETAND